jgi:branched-chain amino acid transport system substrate-binding protein
MDSRLVCYSIIALIAASFAVIPACTAPPTALPTEIPIGCIIPTSSAPTWGPNLVKAAQVAIEDLNANGGAGGKPFKLIVEDEGPTQASALYATHKLVEQSGIKVIVGGTTSEAAMNIGSYASDKNIVIISPSATSSSLAKQSWSKWVFRVSASDSLQGGIAAKVIKDKGYKKVAMLVQDSIYGRGIEETTAQFLKGRADIVISARYDPAKLSYLAELNAIKDKNPDCIFHAGYYDDGAIIYSQALDQGLDGIPWISTDGVYDMPLDKFPVAARFMEKAVTGTVPVPDLQSEKYKKFADRYLALYGFAPTIYCDTTYDSVTLGAAAIKEASTYQGAAIREALSNLAKDFRGASGMITFGQSGDRQEGIYALWKVNYDGSQYGFSITGQPITFKISGL